jgi:hypothetical protein
MAVYHTQNLTDYSRNISFLDQGGLLNGQTTEMKD